jgi:hypothetical protein
MQRADFDLDLAGAMDFHAPRDARQKFSILVIP